ncbi:hypothetical protein [Actinocorallia longicatena]
MPRTVMILMVVVAVLVGAGPAVARGGWAATVVDSGVGRFEAGKAQSIGFWVLQHGFHPYDVGSFGNDLGTVGLKLVAADGTETVFTGSALPEAAHFSATVTAPRDGTYKLYGIQGIFGFDLVGSLTVPGSLTVLPREKPSASEAAGYLEKWGAVHPPYFAMTPAEEGTGMVTIPPQAPPAAVAPAPSAPSATTGRSSSSTPIWIVSITAGALLLGTAFTLYRRRTAGPQRELIGLQTPSPAAPR